MRIDSGLDKTITPSLKNRRPAFISSFRPALTFLAHHMHSPPPLSRVAVCRQRPLSLNNHRGHSPRTVSPIPIFELFAILFHIRGRTDVGFVLLCPCRVISRAQGLKLVVETLMSSLKPIGNIVVICCAFFIIFGILGVQVSPCMPQHQDNKCTSPGWSHSWLAVPLGTLPKPNLPGELFLPARKKQCSH